MRHFLGFLPPWSTSRFICRMVAASILPARRFRTSLSSGNRWSVSALTRGTAW